MVAMLSKCATLTPTAAPMLVLSDALPAARPSAMAPESALASLFTVTAPSAFTVAVPPFCPAI
ncbi:MAG: hypothetical protein Q7V62_11930, partial [Actinomycetota bacterium]|nr:hypothetical protein [Actinomycetota bacterium]